MASSVSQSRHAILRFRPLFLHAALPYNLALIGVDAEAPMYPCGATGLLRIFFKSSD